MRGDYLRNAAVLFVLFIVFGIIWFFFDPTDITLYIASFLLIASIIYFIVGLVQSPPKRPSPTYSPPPMQPQPVYPPQPTYQPVPTPKPAPTISTPTCPSCGRPLTYLPDINKWYCENERKIVTPVSPTPYAPVGQGNVAQQLVAERAKLHNDLQMLDERLVEGKISEGTYKDLKAKYEARLKDIE